MRLSTHTSFGNMNYTPALCKHFCLCNAGGIFMIRLFLFYNTVICRAHPSKVPPVEYCITPLLNGS